ncbi:MAG: aldo/keto reductase [Tabrizicola sp.]|uniref:aldo/keto reductase n=1 Tax=Tabrizicola sp. TaxID=2005166 RepID=UPI002ABB61B2|nr:aldo/keto reductase [Tabrizicola sp.]MDZ4089283.1 aldo/keto reductase [Tabrizicola sp.]
MTDISQGLAFGAMQFGTTADARAAATMVEACLAAGLRDFDTAHGYAGGASERMLGDILRGVEGVRVATKAGYTGGAGRANLTAQLAESLDRLGMPVDLLYLHRFDPDTSLDETVATLVGFKRQGLVRRIGLSNLAAWQVMKAQGIAAVIGGRIDAIQPMYSAVKRQAEVELLPMAMDQGLAVYGYSPLGAGLLSGKYVAGGQGRLTADARYARRYAGVPEGVDAGFTGLAAEAGLHPVTLAVAWVMAHPARVVPIVSARDAAQLAPALAAAGVRLDPALYAAVAALVPTPPPATDRTEEGPG